MPVAKATPPAFRALGDHEGDHLVGEGRGRLRGHGQGQQPDQQDPVGVAPGGGDQLGQGGREPLGVVGGPAGPQVEGGLVDPDGDDDDGLVTEPARAQLGLQPGQQPLGGVAGDAQVEHGVGREGGGAHGDGGVLVERRRSRWVQPPSRST
jgi:hypothetical protein